MKIANMQGSFKMEKIKINTLSKQYHVYVGDGAIQQVDQDLRHMFNHYSKLMVITDETVLSLHIEQLKQALPASLEVLVYAVPASEQAKTFAIYEKCMTFALQNGLDRKSCVLAFGGGVVGDLAGFVAATFMRGVPFIQIPTTILAHDSAVGGKVAINHPLGKNMVGAFYQPEAVLYDTSFLSTLPEREIRSGFAEVVKHAFIADGEFLENLMNQITSFEQLSGEKLTMILKRGIEIKRDIVSQDEKENGIRAYLNFGHTLGHALETYLGYGKTTHGEAVMTGMIFALYLSMKQCQLSFPLNNFIQWIEKLGYDWKIPSSIVFDEIIEVMKRDKKSVSQKPQFVLLTNIGHPILVEVEEPLLKAAFHNISRTDCQ